MCGKEGGGGWEYRVGGICGDPLWRCVYDREVVNTGVCVCGVCTVRAFFRLRAPSRDFTGSGNKVLPSRAASNPIPVTEAGP